MKYCHLCLLKASKIWPLYTTLNCSSHLGFLNSPLIGIPVFPSLQLLYILFHNLNQTMMQFSAQNLLIAHLTRNKSQSSCNGTHKALRHLLLLTSYPFPAFLLAHATSSLTSLLLPQNGRQISRSHTFTPGPSISSKLIPSPQVFFSNVILLKNNI